MSAQPKAGASCCGLLATEAGPRLRELETRRDLLRHRFAGWSIWPLLRIHAAKAMVAAEEWPQSGQVGYGRRELARLAASDMWAFARARKTTDVMVISGSNYRTEQENGAWRDWLFDDFTRGLSRVYRFERIGSPAMHRRNANALFRSDMTNAWFELALRATRRLRRRSGQVAQVAKALTADLAEEPGLASLTPTSVEQQLADFQVRKRLWRLLFKRVRPRVVLIDDGYYQHDLIAGAREAGCCVVELQHGIFLDGGAEYCWPDAACPHREHMPVPDRFFLFGEVWQQLLAKDSFWGKRARVVGSARMDRFRARASTVTRQRESGVECHLVVTTQGMSRERLAAKLGELMRLSKNWAGMRLTVKLHPGYDPDPEPYRRALGSDSRAKVVLGAGEPGTFDLLCQADCHASISSACHYDALALGVRTIVLKLPSHEMVTPVPGDRVATAEELLAAVQRSKAPLPPSIGEQFFRPGAVQNFHREFKELLSEPDHQ